MVWAYADPEEALFVLKMMDLEGDKDDTFTFATVLTACATSCEHALLQTNFLHDRATSLGLGSDPVVVAAVINSYSKSQRLGLARSTFEGLATDKRDAVVRTIRSHPRRSGDLLQDGSSGQDHNRAGAGCLHGSGMPQPVQGRSSRFHVAKPRARVGENGGQRSCKHVREVWKPGRGQESFRQDELAVQEHRLVMISAYAQHARSSESMELFQRMQQQGVEPNQVTFISILSSCSHSGLIDQAAYCFYSMEQDQSLLASQSHLVHMVDLLGRAGMLMLRYTLSMT
ncbi:pentatricopeptide repeat-containing protein At5g66520 [Selaginella moellendorffii]|uniref:pentatricopeptide repeat-containing protein At5g66520 n=1 Tax=Selaginella moellendorffii TaxID=88036 RepID=UPI000D1C30DE|nr:pentatricopeptide repeat-containing protein At5g66520 [Selaginella moellendorffii]|eukprot:XP_024539673.1 pentatricopeptide repeat-containing protein At5g66520 [Selaginella moellendorffii]